MPQHAVVTVCVASLATLACRSDHIRLGLSMAYVLGGECRGAGMYRATPGCGLASSPGALVAQRTHMSFPVAACAISPYLQALTPRSLLSHVTSEHNNFPSRRSLSHPPVGL